MDMSRLDQVARELGAGMPRRGLLGWLIAFVLGGLLSPWRKQETVEGRGRRKRRKKRHKHGQPRPHGKRQRRKRRKKGATCQQGQPCGEPGQICQRDGSCTCTSTSCPECRTCNTVSGLCEPDPGMVGNPCGEPIQVCRPDGVCACSDSGCGGVCGCEAGFICDEGACQPCDVIFDGDSVTSGATLQARMEPPGGTIRVCPGRYQHTFVLNTRANVVVIGAGDGEDEASSTILDAGGSGRTLTINQYATASLRGVRITGGDDTLGGGIRNDGGLTLTACTVSGNDANLGGALYYSNAATGSLALIDCRLTDNDANRGAGIDNNSILAVTLSGCTISKNRSVQDGAGIYNNGGALDITDCEINENEAQGNGGGVYNGSPVAGNSGKVTLDAASRVEKNTAGADGGGIFNDGEVTLNGATVTNNKPDNCAGDPVAGCIEDP